MPSVTVSASCTTANVAWTLWWAAGLAVPFAQLQAVSVEESGWILLACWWASAGWLSLWTPVRRTLRLDWLALVGLAALAHPLLITWPSVQSSEWVDAWQVVARLSAHGVFVLCGLWGTASVLRHAPSPAKALPWVLGTLLTLNLLAVYLQGAGGWDFGGHRTPAAWAYSRWVWNVPADLGGWFSSQTVASAWAVLTLPLVWSLGRWRWLWLWPVSWTILRDPRTAVLVALVGWLGWVLWPRVRQSWAWGLVGLGVFGLWIWQVESLDAMWGSLQPRLATWPVIGQAIIQHPLGIGWSPMAYFEIIRSAPHPIMGHPSSALLAWTLAGGWALGLVCVWLWWVARRSLTRDGLSGALVVGTVLVLISRTPAQAQVGVLVWSLACAWWMQRHEGSHGT